MKQGKRVKPKFPIEYRALIMPVYKEREKKNVTRIALRTVNEFKSFQYEIVVEPKLIGHTLWLNIRGLRAPKVTIPGSGPAVFETEYSDLKGTYEVIISKPGREENKFSVNVSKDEVKVEEIPETKFAEIVTNELEW